MAGYKKALKDYKIPVAKELRFGLMDAYGLQMFLEHVLDKYDLDDTDKDEAHKWINYLEPVEIA